MNSEAPPSNVFGGGSHNLLLKKFAISFGTGLLCAISGIMINLAVRVFIFQPLMPQVAPRGNIFEAESYSLIKYFSAITIGPAIETLIFVVVWFSSGMCSKKPVVITVVFCLLMAFVSWFLHGANWMAVSRAFGFIVLALLFSNYALKESIKSAFVMTAIAHGFWNASAFMIIYLISILR